MAKESDDDPPTKKGSHGGQDPDEIDVEEVLKSIGPGDFKILQKERESERAASKSYGQKEMPKKLEEEPFERLAKKVDEVYANLDELSKGIVQVNRDLRARFESIRAELDRLTTNLRDTSAALGQVRGGFPPQQMGGREEQLGYQTAPSQQQPPPQQSYPPSQYSYQQPPQQYQRSSQPPPQGFFPQQPEPHSFFQPQQQAPPPPPPGMSPEEAVAKGIESLKGTVFEDVIPALSQVASIVFSRILEAKEKILRMYPQFPVQEFEPLLSELRANPRMKLSYVDKRKIVDKLNFWASRLPRGP